MKLRLFLGSSSESKPIVKAVEKALAKEYQVVPWFDDKVFETGSTALADLLRAVRESHLAMFVYAPDDKLTIRGARKTTPRDNVIFELGMFMSVLGPRACFPLVAGDAVDLRMLSDLNGLTTLRFDRAKFSRDPQAALKQPLDAFRKAHKSLNSENGKRAEIAGVWELDWVVESHQFPLVNSHTLELSQVGNRVLGQYVAKPTNGTKIPVAFDGVIEGQVLTGRWVGAGYSGAFQLSINPTWTTMIGRWIGPSHKDGIKSGLYQWRRQA